MTYELPIYLFIAQSNNECISLVKYFMNVYHSCGTQNHRSQIFDNI